MVLAIIGLLAAIGMGLSPVSTMALFAIGMLVDLIIISEPPTHASDPRGPPYR